jgi:NAD(P)-dependent dehydrogenase (short-subunit alcohol dehydrogenase family)
MNRLVSEGLAEKPEDLKGMIAQATPMGRIAETSEIASGAWFLASDDSSFMTGSELVIDGGWTAQ